MKVNFIEITSTEAKVQVERIKLTGFWQSIPDNL
jgi:hypothetical protein